MKKSMLILIVSMFIMINSYGQWNQIKVFNFTGPHISSMVEHDSTILVGMNGKGIYNFESNKSFINTINFQNVNNLAIANDTIFVASSNNIGYSSDSSKSWNILYTSNSTSSIYTQIEIKNNFIYI